MVVMDLGKAIIVERKRKGAQGRAHREGKPIHPLPPLLGEIVKGLAAKLADWLYHLGSQETPSIRKSTDANEARFRYLAANDKLQQGQETEAYSEYVQAQVLFLKLDEPMMARDCERQAERILMNQARRERRIHPDVQERRGYPDDYELMPSEQPTRPMIERPARRHY